MEIFVWFSEGLMIDSFFSFQGVCSEETFVVLLRRTVMEEHPVEEQRSFAAGSQLRQQGELRYDDRTQILLLLSMFTK